MQESPVERAKSFKELSKVEQEIVLQCMRFIAEGNSIEDWEFQTRLGIDRPTLVQIIESWPEIDNRVGGSDLDLAVNNCFNEVCHGVAISPTEFTSWFSHSKDEIKNAYGHWLKLRRWPSGGIR